jgi:hypothetical protein
MAKKFEFELNLPGLNQLMKSAEMQKVLDKKAKAVQTAAGDGFNHRTYPINWIAVSTISRTRRKQNRITCVITLY